MRKFLVILGVSVLAILNNVIAQNADNSITVKGVITDKESGEPILFADIRPFNSKSLKNGAISDDEGIFSINVPDSTRFLQITCVGYQQVVLHIDKVSTQFLKVVMTPEIKSLSEVTVKAKRKRYRNKNRPSVQIIDQVLAHKSENRPENFNYLEYEKYQKIVFSFVNVKDRIKDSKLLEPFSFIFNNTDTTIVPGKTLVPVFLKETLSDFYTRKRPGSTKEIIKAENIIRFDEHINRRSVSASINYLYQNINIYNNNITIFTNQFLSPIASMGPSFYKYYIKDTVYLDSIRCVKLAFEPRNKTDMLFEGDLYITLDSTFAVKKVKMTVNKSINLNWVRDLQIDQEFEKTAYSGWILKTDKMSADFGITQESFGVYGIREASYSNFKFNIAQHDSLYNEPFQVYAEGSEDRDRVYWDKNRLLPLTKSENNVYGIIDSLKQVPQFKRNVAIMSTLSGGFIKAKYFEFGLYSTFLSFNPVEGTRFKMGGRTTPLFSKKFVVEPYLAYGTKDERYKYGLGLTYLFTNKTIFDFPLNTLKLSYQNDIKVPGQELLFTQDDNFLISLKRGTNNKMYYNESWKIEHYKEFQYHFSYAVNYEYTIKSPAGSLYFNNIDYNQNINTTANIKVSQAGITLRYAPHEKYFQGTVYRTPFINKYPVLQLQFTTASKQLGSDYNFSTLKFTLNKRFYMSVLGYTDFITEYGQVFGKVPFLLLNIHRANQSYFYQSQSYNLMNFLEFVSDKYVAVNIDHNFYGFFLNKIPLIKKLNFRELVTFKGLYGAVSNTNDPALQSGLFRFPTNSNGIPLTYTLEKKPYIEVGIGISNIFKVFRIDYIKRLSYLNNPDIAKSGIRLSYKFDF